MHPPHLDLRLDGFRATDEQTEEAFRDAIGIDRTDLVPLAEHHTPEGTSYYLLHHTAATWGTPGEPQLIALHLWRDPREKTFGFTHAPLPLVAMAQAWLAHRGCPREKIRLAPDTGTAAADETTRALEDRLTHEGDHFALLDSYTDDDPDHAVTVVILRSLDEHSPSPFRVLHETVDTASRTHTLREGGFTTHTEALRWCGDALAGKAAPLPPFRSTVRPGPQPIGVPPASGHRSAGRGR
ncbi:hypothetical protein [Streptomyces sp. ST2-7A]|uniref:hypothetical protein n=1 Tax=Streptomyces sp. ST2-7A TaxID=2907214 RepID=UPI001F397201|nr:hypothetical protein [Streptomyces sp. ST2-7A]MCE7081705.1 hypothetical protein [Streptomyces sp. ST2-7A]